MDSLKCNKCGAPLNVMEKFCPECGDERDTILNTTKAAKVYDAESTPQMRNNNVMGNLDVTGTKIETQAYNSDNSIDNSKTVNDNSSVVNTNQSTVYNQTIIDDTKKSVTCEISGRKVLIVDSCQCPSCKRVIASQYYIDSNLRCVQCEKDAENDYETFYKRITADGGALDQSARLILDNKAKKLKLSVEKKDEIEFMIKKSVTKQLSSKLSGLRLKEFHRLLKMIGDETITIDAALLKLESLRNTTSDDDVCYWYYIILAISSPKRYLEEVKNSNIDIYWQQYWLFFVAINKGDLESAAHHLDDLRIKYRDNEGDYVVAETILLLKRYQDTGDDSYKSDAAEGLKLVVDVESSQLKDLLHLLNKVLTINNSVYVVDNNLYSKYFLSGIPCQNNQSNQVTQQSFFKNTDAVPVQSTNAKNEQINKQKGFVLDNSVETPLKVGSKSKSNGIVKILAICGVIVLATATVFILNNKDNTLEEQVASSPKQEIVQKVETVTTTKPKVEEAPTAKPVKLNNEQTVKQSSGSTMAKRSASTNKSVSNSQAEQVYNQAEQAYKSGNYTEAVAFYKKAANLNSKKACLKLSEIYTTGVGNISANTMQAKVWSNKAAKLND